MATATGATSSAVISPAELGDGTMFRRIDRYLAGARLGSGGTAAVYLARALDAQPNSPPLALKIVHEHLTEESEFLDQFADEAAILLNLTHPNIVRVHDRGRDGAMPYLVMEYLDGQPLSRLISALARRRTRLAPELVAWIGARVADGLAYAHAACDAEGTPLALIHRDVSPQNVFVTYRGEVKIIDFGIARARGRLSRTTHGKVKGKFSYMAPEQLLSARIDQRVDLFALGATLYEAAVGQRLFGALEETEALHRLLFEKIADPRQHVPALPAELARVIMWGLEREPQQRPASAAEIAQALDAFLASRSVHNPEPALGRLARELFCDERDQRAREISELDNWSRESVATLRPAGAERGNRRARAYAAAIAIGAATSIGGALYVTKSAPPAASQPALAQEVQLDLAITPPVAATISIAGRALRGPIASVRWQRGDRPLPIEISAPGYQSVQRTVVPDRDRALSVTLAPDPPSAPSSAPSATAAAPQRRGPAPKSKPARTKDSLVTDYPY